MLTSLNKLNLSRTIAAVAITLSSTFATFIPASQIATATTQPPEGWQRYEDEKFQFRIDVPNSWYIMPNKMELGGGSTTITSYDLSNVREHDDQHHFDDDMLKIEIGLNNVYVNEGSAKTISDNTKVALINSSDEVKEWKIQTHSGEYFAYAVPGNSKLMPLGEKIIQSFAGIANAKSMERALKISEDMSKANDFEQALNSEVAVATNVQLY